MVHAEYNAKQIGTAGVTSRTLRHIPVWWHLGQAPLQSSMAFSGSGSLLLEAHWREPSALASSKVCVDAHVCPFCYGSNVTTCLYNEPSILIQHLIRRTPVQVRSYSTKTRQIAKWRQSKPTIHIDTYLRVLVKLTNGKQRSWSLHTAQNLANVSSARDSAMHPSTTR